MSVLRWVAGLRTVPMLLLALGVFLAADPARAGCISGQACPTCPPEPCMGDPVWDPDPWNRGPGPVPDPGPSPDELRARSLFQEGLEHGKQGRYLEAVSTFREVLRLRDGDDDAARYNIANNLCNHGSTMVGEANQRFAAGNDEGGLSLMRGTLSYYRQGLEADSGHAGCRSAQASVSADLRRMEGEVQKWQDVNRLWQRGSELWDKGDYLASAEIWRQIARLDPSQHNAFKNWGFVLFNAWLLMNADDPRRQEIAKEAIGALTQALRLNPRDETLYAMMGKVLAAAGRHEEARFYVQEALRRGRAVSAVEEDLEYLSSARFWDRDYEESERYLNIWLQLSPRSDDARQRLANVYYRWFEAAEAVKDSRQQVAVARRLVAFDATKPGHHAYLGRALILDGDVAAGKAAYLEAIARAEPRLPKLGQLGLGQRHQPFSQSVRDPCRPPRIRAFLQHVGELGRHQERFRRGRRQQFAKVVLKRRQ